MSEQQDHVIRRSGGFYRPGAKGYTQSVSEAGRWSRTEALAYQKGVEGVTVHHVNEFPVHSLDLVAGLTKAMEIVGDMRQSEAGLFDAKHSGQRGEDRSNALYDAYVAIRAALPSTNGEAQ